jgi:outer membrane protein assembly factor BamD (BamD/ComL family)
MRPFVLILMLGMAWSRAAAQTEYTLDDFDQWKPAAGPQATDPTLQQAQLALANGEPDRALTIADGFLDQNPISPARPEALLIRGDALLALDNEYQALFAYEEVARRYATTPWFVPALEREYEIGKAYAHGLRRKFFGTFRMIDAGEDAQEILIRIQERLPGSELAEKAGMELADYYFRIRDMPLAADAYDLFVQNYPRSRQVTKARLRLIYSYYAQFKGPEFEGKGLEEATSRLRQLQAEEPAVAQKIGSDALLVRIYESEAARLRSQAEWYMRVDDWIAAELTIRALVKRYPNSIATIEALREIPTVLEKLPAAVVKQCPDYAALRKSIVGVDGGPEPAGVAPAPEAPLPAQPQVDPQTPVKGAQEPDPQAAQGPSNQEPPRRTP